jgi:hypothetical protein
MVVLYPKAESCPRYKTMQVIGQDERRPESGVYHGVVDVWETDGGGAFVRREMNLWISNNGKGR